MVKVLAIVCPIVLPSIWQGAGQKADQLYWQYGCSRLSAVIEKTPDQSSSHLPNTAVRGAAVSESGYAVGHSAPVRGAAYKPTNSDLKSDALLCSADCNGRIDLCNHHAKSGWGSGGEAPSIGIGEADAPFFNPIENNRNQKWRRNPWCGRFTAVADDPATQTRRVIRLDCKCWPCCYCGPRKARRYRHAIRRIAEKRRLHRFLTLTLDPSKIEGEPVEYLNRTFAKFRVSLKRKLGKAPSYIRILEFQENGNPHFHILLSHYVEFAWIQEAWQAVGGGKFVNIKHVDVHRVSRYLSKYLTQDLLLSAHGRSRRVTSSRDIHLLEKLAPELEWLFCRASIFYQAKLHGVVLISFSADEEGFLKNFVAKETAN